VLPVLKDTEYLHVSIRIVHLWSFVSEAGPLLNVSIAVSFVLLDIFM
jgi:hypothetical protein